MAYIMKKKPKNQITVRLTLGYIFFHSGISVYDYVTVDTLVRKQLTESNASTGAAHSFLAYWLMS